jgi:hypothetical protein
MKLIFIFILFFFQLKTPTYDFAKDLITKYDPPKKDYIVLIDYSKPIFQERLYVFDMKKQKIIITSYVSHAFNSGKIYATDFSNIINSKKTSIGAYITLNSYYGKWGYSMRLKGVDSCLNTKAEKRNIVFHPNVTDNINYSDGCFMTKNEINKKIIDLVKNGYLVYVFI